ncbi:hypothetical protein [Saccharothrix deserti]|uniref:hypothetical protein n=1 Tax=Saccharothrix deserti TaxID=2593674 RepID=UPI00131A60E8|nr:hypothetical protein [Saccharothrix deserti]
MDYGGIDRSPTDAQVLPHSPQTRYRERASASAHAADTVVASADALMASGTTCGERGDGVEASSGASRRTGDLSVQAVIAQPLTAAQPAIARPAIAQPATSL